MHWKYVYTVLLGKFMHWFNNCLLPPYVIQIISMYDDEYDVILY